MPKEKEVSEWYRAKPPVSAHRGAAAVPVHSLPRIKSGKGAVCFPAVTTRDSRAPLRLPAASWKLSAGSGPAAEERAPQRPGAWPRGSRLGGSGERHPRGGRQRSASAGERRGREGLCAGNRRNGGH